MQHPKDTRAQKERTHEKEHELPTYQTSGGDPRACAAPVYPSLHPHPIRYSPLNNTL